MEKITHINELRKPKSVISTLKELMVDLEEDRVTDFIIISRVKDGTSDDTYDGHVIKYNWMGRDSSILCLGLLDYMKSKIKDFIWDRE